MIMITIIIILAIEIGGRAPKTADREREGAETHGRDGGESK